MFCVVCFCLCFVVVVLRVVFDNVFVLFLFGVLLCVLIGVVFRDFVLCRVFVCVVMPGLCVRCISILSGVLCFCFVM